MNNLQGNNSRVAEAENQISDLEYKEAKNNCVEQEDKRTEKSEDSINNLWGNFKRSNIHIIGVPKGEKKEQEIVNLLMRGNFPNLVKEIDIQVQEAQRVLNKLDASRSTPRHIIIKMPKMKHK